MAAHAAEAKQKLVAALKLLGFAESIAGLGSGESANETMRDAYAQVVGKRLAARAEARKARNYAEADRIRAELDAMGIALKDSKDPETGELVTTWEVKR